MKRFYARTNKNMAVHQMTRLERREHALRKLAKSKGKTSPLARKKSAAKLRPNVPFEDSEALPYTPAEKHHHISMSRNYHMNIMAFLSSNRDDPAITVSFDLLAIGGYTDLLFIYLCRISALNLKSTFLHAFNILPGPVMGPNSQKTNAEK